MRRLLRDVAEGRDPRRHHHAGRPGAWSRRSGGCRRPRRPRSERPGAPARPTGPGTDWRAHRRTRARPSSSTSTACCPTRSAASTSSSGAGATGTPSSTPAATTRSSTRWPGCSSCSTRGSSRPAHRPAHAGAAPDPGLAGALRPAVGPAGHAGPGRLRAGDLVQAGRGGRAPRTTASICAWPSRTTPATSPCSTPRASPASTSTPATTSRHGPVPHAAVVGPRPPAPAGEPPAADQGHRGEDQDREVAVAHVDGPVPVRRSRVAGTTWRAPSTERSSSVPRWVMAALYPVGAACSRSRPCWTAWTVAAAISWVGTWAGGVRGRCWWGRSSSWAPARTDDAAAVGVEDLVGDHGPERRGRGGQQAGPGARDRRRAARPRGWPRWEKKPR